MYEQLAAGTVDQWLQVLRVARLEITSSPLTVDGSDCVCLKFLEQDGKKACVISTTTAGRTQTVTCAMCLACNRDKFL